MARQTQTVVAVALFASVAVAARQSAVKPTSTGIAECDRYAAMVTACLPKVCEVDRVVMELDLGFHHELLPTVVKVKGRQEAAKQCAAKIDEAIRDDEYGCYPEAAGSPRAVLLDRIQPRATSVTLTFSGNGPADGGDSRLLLLTSIGEPPLASYRLAGWQGPVVVDTASAMPLAGGAGKAPIQLEPGTTYCFVVESSTATRRDSHRKGVFTTLPKR
jgi:hypothetical protein